MSDQPSREQTDVSRSDPWEVHGFRVVPCASVDSVWVEISTPGVKPDDHANLSLEATRELAEHMVRVAATAGTWRGPSKMLKSGRPR